MSSEDGNEAGSRASRDKMASTTARAYRITLETSCPGIHAEFRSVTFAQHADDLAWTANEIGVRPLTDFCQPGLFSAAEGLHSVQALSREISALLDLGGWTEEVLADLCTCEQT